ncbi:MAG: class F sortase [Patescibacteria group bacterium]|nr:class F sortase [Patescibacteria group bacterium]
MELPHVIPSSTLESLEQKSTDNSSSKQRHISSFFPRFVNIPEKIHVYVSHHIVLTLVLLLVLSVFVFGFFIVQNLQQNSSNQNSDVFVIQDETISFNEENSIVSDQNGKLFASLASVPIELRIPKLNIVTTVEHVGQTKTYEMDVPKNAANVAWYVYGAKPGEEGNAVVSGHYDTPSGKPAVFYKLKTLEVGDDVIVISEDGKETRFVVTGKEMHHYKNFPSEYVFFKKPGKNLNLITCGGIWDKKEQIYNERLVVYTELKE